ncbi:polysaccharide deacetylase family protein [Paenibacillus sp. GCM10012303]|uniref:polysaccharide deacetylase family protein n=1 Tax=Paenibacillus sp. GCM10012303 TaxID=3317340 RepID=UPI00361108BE
MLQKRGSSETDRLLIVNADDFGMCHSGNEAIIGLLREGLISSATLMTPCPWALEAAKAAADNPHFDVGVHLTLTSEWKMYKWGPVTRNADVSSLITPEGYFPAKCREVEERADSAQVKTELRNQVLLAMRLGVDPTHLDNHMGSVYGIACGRDFLREAIELCAEFRLPFRLPRQLGDNGRKMSPEMRRIYEERVRYADACGIALIDHLLGLPYSLEEHETYDSFKAKMIDTLRSLQPGISEIIIHPFFATEELKAITGQWAKRQMEYELFRDADVRRVIDEENIRMTNWRMLRDAQRGG